MFKKIGFKTKVVLEAVLSIVLIASFVSWYKPVTVEATQGFLSIATKQNIQYSGESWLAGYNYRKQISINGTSDGAQTNYQMKLTVNNWSGSDSGGTVYLGGKYLSFPNDIRFTQSDGSTLLDFWRESSQKYGTDAAITDMATSINFMRPTAVCVNGVDYIAYASNTNVGGKYYTKIFTYTESTGVFSSPVTVDNTPINSDYAYPTLAIDNSGYIHVFWTEGTTGTQGGQLHHRVSSNTYDISTWGNGNVPADTAAVSHPGCVKDSSGNLYLIYNFFTSATKSVLRIRKSTDGGANWANPLTGDLVDFGDNIYLWIMERWVDSSDNIHIGFNPSDHADEYLYDLFYMVGSSTGTVWKKADGTTITTPGTAATADQVFDSAANQEVRCASIKTVPATGYPYILMSRRGTTNMEWQLATWGGASWTINAIGQNSGHTDEGWGEMEVTDANNVTIYLDYWSPSQVLSYKTANAGSTWALDQTIVSTAEAGAVNWGLLPVIGNTGALKYFWLQSNVPRFYGTHFKTQTVWVEFNSLAASPTTTNFYMYYGKASDTDASNGDNTFIYFDFFDDNSLDTSKWDTILGASCTANETGGEMRLGVPAGGVWKSAEIVHKTARTLNAQVSLNFKMKRSADSYQFVYFNVDRTTPVGGASYLYYGWFEDTAADEEYAYRINSGGTGVKLWSDTTAFTKTTYATIEIRLTSSNMQVIRDGTSKFNVAHGATWGATNAYPRFSQYFNDASIGYYDQFYGRNYTANEPTWGTWGVEETALSISNSPTSKAFGVVQPSSTYWSNGSAPAFGAGGSFNSTNSSSSNSGTWTNPTNAYADGGGYADVTSGSPSANQTYGTYGFGTIPTGSTINSLRVRTDAYSIGGSGITRQNSPSSQSGWWNNPTNAYDSAASYTDKTSGTPSANQTFGGYGFNLSTESITSVKVKPNAYTTGETSVAVLDTKRPTADNLTTGYAPVPASPTTIYDKVNEVVVDHLKYAVGQTNGGATLLFNHTAYAIASDATINWVAVEYYSTDNASGTNNVSAALKVNGTVYAKAGNSPGASWVKYTDNWTTNPNTSSSWTAGDVNGTSASPLQNFGITSNDYNPDVNVDTISITVSYTPATVYNELLRCDVSWDGGSTWSASQNATMTSSNATYTFDFTSAVSWNGTYLNDTNFKVRIDAYTVGGASDVRVSWIPVEVIYTALNNEQLNVYVTWDGGTSLSSAYTHALTGSETTYWDNVTSATSWTVDKLSDSNFKVYVSGTTVGLDNGDVRLDWIPVEVYYTTPSGVLPSECYFTLVNNGGVSANITVKSFNFTSSGTSWNITDDSPSLDTTRLSVFRAGDSSSGNTTLGLSDRVFKNNLAASENVSWELKLETGTFSDGASNNTTIRFTAIQS